MNVAYLDTSAVVKLYASEVGTDWLRGLSDDRLAGQQPDRSGWSVPLDIRLRGWRSGGHAGGRGLGGGESQFTSLIQCGCERPSLSVPPPSQ